LPLSTLPGAVVGPNAAQLKRTAVQSRPFFTLHELALTKKSAGSGELSGKDNREGSLAIVAKLVCSLQLKGGLTGSKDSGERICFRTIDIDFGVSVAQADWVFTGR